MFRNKEIRRFAVLYLVMAMVFTCFGFGISTAAGILVFLSAAVSGAAFFVFTRVRYQKIAQIADQIDQILHKEEHLFIGEAEEGELSILQSEVMKMTLRIREQNEALKKEKENLADSLADIAHQLRTPLTSVNLILTLLENDPETEERQSFVREMEELLARMDWLLTSLLKLSRLDAGIVVFQCRQMEVKELIDVSLRPLLIPMELHMTKLQICVPEKAVIRGDQEWLSQALQNILKNGMESAGENGLIEIGCQDTALYTEITIHDSGAGFAPEELAHLFDRFYRGKNTSKSGYGIGLALGRSIITRQGGTITAKNHPQGGAVFAIRFPK